MSRESPKKQAVEKPKRRYQKPEVIKVSEEVLICTASCCSTGYSHGFAG